MKVFSIFSKNKDTGKTKSKAASDVVSVSGSVGTQMSGGSGLSKASRNKNKGKHIEVDTEKEDELTKNIKAAEVFMEAMNAYTQEDREGFLKKLANCYESMDTKVVLEDGEAYKPEACNFLIDATHQSFPDFRFRWGEIAPVDKNPNRIAVEEVFAEGTFSGKPYTIMPGVLPELKPTGKYNYNDEQRFELTMKNGKIARFEVYALGIHTGFAGFYTRAGGSLVPPNTTEDVTDQNPED